MNIVIAGASRGIGFEVVRNLARTGDHVILAGSRDLERLEILSAECRDLNPGSGVVPVRLDLEEDSSVKEFTRSVEKEFDRVDLLLYNAGFLVNKKFKDLEEVDIDRSFRVNVKGAFLLVRALLSLFPANAHILTISSMGGFQGSAKFPGLSAYSSSKGALAVLTECLAVELGEQSVKCNCLALGAAQTEMFATAFPGYEAPLSAGEMAGFIADFALNGHRYFNGKILPVSLSTP